MQMLKPSDTNSAFGGKDYWYDALHDPGASQLTYLKKLMLSRPYFERLPDQTLIASQSDRYSYQVATRGERYAFVYTYRGEPVIVHMGVIAGTDVKASWYDPRTGETQEIGKFRNEGTHAFDPPGNPADGNDWVLILDTL